MKYHREHNYLLDEDNHLIAFNLEEDGSLYILREHGIKLIKATDDQNFDNEDNLVRPADAKDITSSEWENFLENTDMSMDCLLEIDEDKIEGWENNDFAVIRFIKTFTDYNSPEFYEALGELNPLILEIAQKYFEAIKSAPKISILYSYNWVGFTDSDIIQIYAFVDHKGLLNLKMTHGIGVPEGDPEAIYYEYYNETNLDNEVEDYSASGINSTEEFVTKLTELLLIGTSDNKYVELKDINLNFEKVATIINSMPLAFKLQPLDIEMAYHSAMNKKDEYDLGKWLEKLHRDINISIEIYNEKPENKDRAVRPLTTQEFQAMISLSDFGETGNNDRLPKEILEELISDLTFKMNAVNNVSQLTSNLLDQISKKKKDKSSE